MRCCDHPVERHAYNGCANCGCAVRFGSPLAAPAVAAAPERGRAIESPGDAYQREREAERDALAARVTGLSERLYSYEQRHERIGYAYLALLEILPVSSPELNRRLRMLSQAIRQR